MQTKKYKTTQVILDKTRKTQPITCLNILELDNGVAIAFGYAPKARKSHCIVAVYKGMACLISTSTNKTIIDNIHTLTSDMIINRYKELSLIK